MKYVVILSLLALTACAGEDGHDGVNGLNGADGIEGTQGLPGANGTNAEMSSYALASLNQCVVIEPGVYAKRVDTSAVRLYTSSGCASANQIDTGGDLCQAGNEFFVLSSKALIVVNGSGASTTIKKITFQ